MFILCTESRFYCEILGNMRLQEMVEQNDGLEHGLNHLSEEFEPLVVQKF